MSTSELAGVYNLPVPIWVAHETFGTSSMTAFRGLPFEVRMPVRAMIEDQDVVSPPDLPGVSSDDEKLAASPWAMNYAAEPTAPSMALCRVGLICQVNENNAARSRFGDGAAASFRVGDALAQRIESWFDELRSWTEVVTGQDLDFRHPVADAEDPAEGLLLAHPTGLRSSGLGRFTTRVVRPVTLAEWTKILKLVAAGQRPPTEHLLMRNAHAALARDMARRAVLESATATEIVLNRVLKRTADGMPTATRSKFLKKQRTLGSLMNDLKGEGVVLNQPWDNLAGLASLRNAAIHEGAEPDHLEALVGVSSAAQLVSSYGTLSSY